MSSCTAAGRGTPRAWPADVSEAAELPRGREAHALPEVVVLHAVELARQQERAKELHLFRFDAVERVDAALLVQQRLDMTEERPKVHEVIAPGRPPADGIAERVDRLLGAILGKRRHQRTEARPELSFEVEVPALHGIIEESGKLSLDRCELPHPGLRIQRDELCGVALPSHTGAVLTVGVKRAFEGVLSRAPATSQPVDRAIGHRHERFRIVVVELVDERMTPPAQIVADGLVTPPGIPENASSMLRARPRRNGSPPSSAAMR